MEKKTQAKPIDEREYVLSFIDNAREYRKRFDYIWRETLQNYLVKPFRFEHATTRTQQLAKRSILKDPETHQAVETMTAEMISLLFPEEKYVAATPRGFEDAALASTADRLLDYVFRLPGHHLSMHSWIKDSYIFGTGILHGSWLYEERDEMLQDFAVFEDEAGNVFEIGSDAAFKDVAYDDYKLDCVDIFDFFPDPGNSMIDRMRGCGMRFRITEIEARGRIENSTFNQPKAARRAIDECAGKDSFTNEDETHREDLDREHDVQKTVSDLKPMIGYVYYGDVPYKHKDGAMRRRVTVLGNHVVDSRPYYGQLPFFSVSPVPLSGRFYGLAPAETIRYHQDFIDALLMNIADASHTSVNPPVVVDRNADVRLSDVRHWSRDRPILARDVNAINPMRYDPQIGPAASIMQLLKSNVRGGTGALGALQGVSDGPDRESATGFSGRLNQARGRSNLTARLIESNDLPPLGKHIIRTYAQTLSDSPDLWSRVGELPPPASLGEMQVDFDVKFVGSRHDLNQNQRINANREFFALMQNPYALQFLAPVIPGVIAKHLREMGLHDEAAIIAQQAFSPEQAVNFAQQIQGGLPGNGNDEAPSQPPSGLLPEQLAGA